jgi:hypothetical protein
VATSTDVTAMTTRANATSRAGEWRRIAAALPLPRGVVDMLSIVARVVGALGL